MDSLVIPLFPTPLCLYRVEEDLSALQKIKDLEFHSTSPDEKTSSMSKSLRVLEKFPKEKQIIETYFKNYTDEVFKLHNVEFAMSTSWATLTEQGCSSRSHHHANVAFSGVLYLDGSPQDTNVGQLEFESLGIIPDHYLFSIAEHNQFNVKTMRVVPQKNLLLFFPSYVRHSITRHDAPEKRYSLAFNFVPVGVYGDRDSTVNMRSEGVP